MFRNARGLGVLAGIVALVVGVLGNAPAHAAESWSVVWNGTALIPSIVPAAVGDQIILTKPGNVQDTVEAFNDTGQLSGPNGLCNVFDACVLDQAASLNMTVVQLGDVLIRIGGQTVATLSLVAASGAAGPYTMTFDGNGATSCTPRSASGPGTAAYRLPSPGTCVRAGYRLEGWSHAKSAKTPDDGLTQPADSTQGIQALFADNGTLYAVWAPVGGVEITYDSNVGWAMPCISSTGANVADEVAWSARLKAYEVITNNRTTTQLHSLSSEPRHTAFCKPSWLVLSGWSTSPLDAFVPVDSALHFGTIFPLQKNVGASDPKLAIGDRVTLYAMWTVPRVTLLRTGTEDRIPVAWNSTLPTWYPPGQRPAAASSTSDTCQVSASPVGDTAMPFYSFWFYVQDTLGEPAPYTSVFFGADSARVTVIRQDSGPGAFVGSAGPAGLLAVTTDGSGWWPMNDVRDPLGSVAFVMSVQMCPPAGGSNSGPGPSMWVLTGGQKDFLGRIYFSEAKSLL